MGMTLALPSLQNAKRTPSAGEVKYTGEFTIFDRNSHYFGKRHEIDPRLVWITLRK